ncbi:hypothetical protein D3C75_1084970 [compost metagenome]
MGHRPQPGIVDLDPAPRGKPFHTIDLKPAHLPRVVPLMGAIPVFDTVVDPAMKAPEYRAHMRRERIAKEVVFRTVPARSKISRIAGKRYRRTVDRIPRYRGPAHVQPVVQVHLQL